MSRTGNANAVRVLAFVLGLGGSHAALAQAYPAKPVRLIVPFAAGGAVDVSARAMGGVIGESIGQPVVIETRPGGSSIIGMMACAKSAPDGYTLCITVADSLSYNPHLFKSLPYDPDKDFAPVINMVRGNSMLFAKSNAPFNSFGEMLAYAKANPGTLNWGTWGPASLPEMYLNWIRREAGVDIAPVPYKGAGQAVPAVIAGEVDITFMTIGAMLPHVKSGKVKALAVIGTRRSPLLADVPSLGEVGADPGLASYFGVFAPGGTPKPVVDRLNAEFNKALQTPRMQEFFRGQTLDIVGGSPEQFAEFLKADRANAGRVFRALGLKPVDAPS